MNRTSNKPRPLAPPLRTRTGGATLPALGLCLAAGCGSVAATDQNGNPVAYDHQAQGSPPPQVVLPNYQYVPTGPALQQSAGQTSLRDDTIDYGLALRSASIKLRGDLPSMKEIRRLQNAVKVGASDGTDNDPYAVYKDQVRSYIYDAANSAAFNRQMVNFWRATLRMSGKLSALTGATLPNLNAAIETNLRTVDLETGPALAAMLVAKDQDMRLLFTQGTGNCPSFLADGTFSVPAAANNNNNCFTGATIAGSTATTVMGNNVMEGKQAGVLTNPGFMASFYSNMGMRRARVINEIFACQRYPAEYAPKPTFMTSFLYSSPWAFNSIANSVNPPTFSQPRPIRVDPNLTKPPTTSATKDYVHFDSDCQNCHSSLNHRAPLFGVFDAIGFSSGSSTTMMVQTPVTDSPFTQIQEYLPAGMQTTAWKNGVPAPDFQSFGAAMAADPQVQSCFMIRAWNNAYSRGDVTIDLALVPQSVIQQATDYFVAQGFNMKKALLYIYTDPNYLRFN